MEVSIAGMCQYRALRTLFCSNIWFGQEVTTENIFDHFQDSFIIMSAVIKRFLSQTVVVFLDMQVFQTDGSSLPAIVIEKVF